MSRKIGVFSGTFDPVHSGHLGLADLAAKRLELGKLVLLPEAKPRRKSQVSPLASRVEMLKIATKDIDKCEVFTGKEPSHLPVQTMAELHAKYGPDGDYYLIMGGDVFEHIEKWPNYQVLASENSFIIGLRTEDDGEVAVEVATRLKIQPTMIVSPRPNTSSSEIRATIKKGNRPEDVDSSVLEYIQKNQLYE